MTDAPDESDRRYWVVDVTRLSQAGRAVLLAEMRDMYLEPVEIPPGQVREVKRMVLGDYEPDSRKLVTREEWVKSVDFAGRGMGIKTWKVLMDVCIDARLAAESGSKSSWSAWYKTEVDLWSGLFLPADNEFSAAMDAHRLAKIVDFMLENGYSQGDNGKVKRISKIGPKTLRLMADYVMRELPPELHPQLRDRNSRN